MKKTGGKNKRRSSPCVLAGLVLLLLMTALFVSMAMFTSFDEVTNRLEPGRINITLLEPQWNPEDAREAVPNEDIPKDPYIRNDEEVPAYVFLKVTVPYDLMTVEMNDFVGGADENIAADNGGTVDFTAEMPYYKFIVKENETAQGSSIRFVYDKNHDSSQLVYSSSWQLIDGPGADDRIASLTNEDANTKEYTYLYAYMDASNPSKMYPLMPGEETHRLFDKLHVVNFREVLEREDPEPDEDFPKYDRDYSVTVEAYGIQANFLAQNNQTTYDPYEVWEILSNSSSN